MSYYFSKILNTDFDSAISRVTDELKKEGFGVLTEIDVKESRYRFSGKILRGKQHAQKGASGHMGSKL